MSGASVSTAPRAFVHPRRPGVVTSADGAYKFPGAETGLLPDIGFRVAARRARIAGRGKPIPFAPDLAVAMASPSRDAGNMAAKAWHCLRGGARLVWIVWPDRRKINVWRPGKCTSAGRDPRRRRHA